MSTLKPSGLILSLCLLSACITVVQPGQPGASPTPQATASATATPEPTSMPTAVPTIAPTPAVMPPSMVGYEDLFEKPENLASGWQIEDAPEAASGPSSWRIADGKLVQSSNIYRSKDEYTLFEGSSAITRQGPWQNIQLLVRIKPTDDDGVGVLFRYKDRDNHYRLLSVKDSGNKGPFTRLEVKQDGVYRILAENSEPLHALATDAPVAIRISASGSEIKVDVNETERFSVSDATHASGRAGLMTYACSAEFSEFRLRRLP